MLNKIKQIIGLNNKEYLDLTLYNRAYKKGLRLVKIPYNKVVLTISITIFIIAILTPLTNFILIPLSWGVLKKWG